MRYATRVKEFEGPLDVLLNLIEKKELSISEVSLGRVTEEFLAYIGELKEKDPGYHEEIAAFLVVAATLMLIKSRSLLPGFAVTQEEEADIKELEERLEAYKRVKDLAEALGKKASARQELFTRSPFVAVAPEFSPPARGLDLLKMADILKNLLESIPKKTELPQKVIKKIVSIEEKIEELRVRIEEGVIKTFGDFVGKRTEKVNVVVSFLAMLELMKLGLIAARQNARFDLIHIDAAGSHQNN